MEQQGEEGPAGPGRVAAVLAVAVIAVALGSLPSLTAAGPAAGAGQQVAAGLGSLVAVVGGVKLVAVAWGLASRLAAGAEGQRAAAVVD